MHNLHTYLEAALEAANRGAAILEDWRKRFQVREKGRADLVTEADLASQRAIHDYLHGRFPDHEFLEEEGQPERRLEPDAPPTWVVDPLDGTTNYVHDCPWYAVSIGLWLGGEMAVGVVHDPRMREVFSAAKGHGAYLNGSRIEVSKTATLEQAMLATGFPPDMRGQERSLDWWGRFSVRAQSLRRIGSTAGLNLAYVAAGRIDAWWAHDNHAWDVAGGVVLVTEAGGVVTNTDGTSYDPFTPDGLACNRALHPLMLEVLLSPSEGT